MAGRIVIVLATLAVALPLTVVATRWLAPRYAPVDATVHSPITELIDQMEASGYVGSAIIAFQAQSSREMVPLVLGGLIPQFERVGFQYNRSISNVSIDALASSSCVPIASSPRPPTLVFDRPNDVSPSGRLNRVVLTLDEQCRIEGIEAANAPYDPLIFP